MLEFFASLPLASQIVIPILLLCLVIVIALRGRLGIKVSGAAYQIGLGGNGKDKCKKCVGITFSEREKTEFRIRKLESRILRDQVNFAKHKIDSMLFHISQDYREHLQNKRLPGSPIDVEREHKEDILHEEILKNALYTAMDEVQRSFMENGFHDLSGINFQNYVKNKSIQLLNIARSYFTHRYPPSGMIIPIDERLSRINIERLEDICFDIYVNAKDVRNNTEQEIYGLEIEYINKINELVGVKDA